MTYPPFLDAAAIDTASMGPCKDGEPTAERKGDRDNSPNRSCARLYQCGERVTYIFRAIKKAVPSREARGRWPRSGLGYAAKKAHLNEGMSVSPRPQSIAEYRSWIFQSQILCASAALRS